MMQFKRILVAIDFSDNSSYAFDYALSLARQSDSELFLLHVINEPVDLRGFYVPHISFEQLEKEIAAGASVMMDDFCREKLADYANFKTFIVSGTPFDEIIRKAEEVAASLIVIGTHGRTGIDHIIFGSTAERVVRGATCPVLTIRLPEESE
jgi:nucleotide-binding universal stress UspA family protein